MMPVSTTFWIHHFGLIPHSEGGYFREVYRSSEAIPHDGLPKRFDGERSFITSIYYLLEGRQPSRLHKLHADEIWYFHAGSALTMHLFGSNGDYSTVALGHDPGIGQQFQAVIPAGTWFGAVVNTREAYALVSCTVAPGFDYRDWVLGDREELLRAYPAQTDIIMALTSGS
jgi:uncharacterized protein